MTVADQAYTIKKEEDSQVKRIEEDIGSNAEYLFWIGGVFSGLNLPL